MGTLALKTVSGVAATCAWTGGMALLRIIILWVTGAMWLMALLTVIWPFVAVWVLVCGPSEMKQDMPLCFACWVFNVTFFAVCYAVREGPPKGH